MNTLLTLAFLFAVGSFLGWCLEVVFRHFVTHKWINPGFLIGPYLPLYGFSLCMLYALARLEPYIPIQNYILKKLVLFVIMAICITAIEYIAGLIFIKGMNIKLWDYSDQWGNVQGIICPLFSFFWLLLSATYYFFIHPYILNSLDWLAQNLAFSFIIGFFFGIFVLDLVYSLRLVRRIRLFAAEHQIVVRLEELKANILASKERNGEKRRFLFAFRSGIPLKEHLERALELLGDIVFHSTFPQHEIEKETEVIIDEIQSYEDTPSELIFDDFEDMIFRNHPLGRNILGKPELLRSFRTEGVLSFTRRFYQPGNMVFFVQGQYDFRRIIRLVEKYLSDIPDVRVENRRTPPPLYVPEHLTVPRDTHQAHVMIGSRGYNAYDDKRTALYLLNNVLGGPGMNSKLNVSLRERRGLVYNVESNLTSYTDTGAFCIYFGTDVDDMDTCLKLTYKELKRMRDVKMTSSQLVAAKKQLIGQIGVASDNFENNALGMAKTYLHYHKYESSELVFKRIEELTAEQLLEVANEMFAEEYLSTLIYK